MKFILPTLLATALLVPVAAHAETVPPDPDAQQVTALGGTIVWTSGASGGKLMHRDADGKVTQIGEATAFRNPDLGRDAQGRLLLTYARCTTLSKCTYVRDDLAGDAVRFKGLAPKNCAVSSPPAVWRSTVAYGLSCSKRVGGRRVADNARTGLYVKKGAKKAIRLSAPRNAKKAGSLMIDDVDLRGSQVAAIYADIYAFAVVQSTTGSLRRSTRVATSEGDGEQRSAGVVLGTGDVRIWSLSRSSHAESPAQTIIHRIAKSCDDYQTLTGASHDDHPLTDLAVDDGTLYAVDPGVGIVSHAYAKTAGC